MSISPASDIATMIQDATDLVKGTDLFIGEMPDKPNECVSVFDSGGASAPETNYDLSQPIIAVLVRSTSYDGAFTTAKTIQDYLNGRILDTQGSNEYIAVWCIGDIAYINKDERKRTVFSMNFRTMKTTV